MHDLQWITMFWSWVRWFANDFHEWRRHEWKSLANHITSDQTNRYSRVTNVLFYFLHASLSPEYTILLKQSSIAHFVFVAKEGIFWLSIVTSSQWMCDVTRTRVTSIVTSYSSIVLASANWPKGEYSLVNNNREYRFLATRYSRPSM